MGQRWAGDGLSTDCLMFFLLFFLCLMFKTCVLFIFNVFYFNMNFGHEVYTRRTDCVFNKRVCNKSFLPSFFFMAAPAGRVYNKNGVVATTLFQIAWVIPWTHCDLTQATIEMISFISFRVWGGISFISLKVWALTILSFLSFLSFL